MTDLLLCPAVTGAKEATTYIVLFPHDGRYSILWSMWCSSLRWALQDTAQDFKPFLDEMFPEGVQIHYKRINSIQELKDAVASMNLENTYDFERLRLTRARYGLPPWNPNGDKYRYINYEMC